MSNGQLEVSTQEVLELIAKQQLQIHRMEGFLRRTENDFRELANRYADLKIKYEPETDEAKQIKSLREQAEAMKEYQDMLAKAGQEKEEANKQAAETNGAA